MTETHSAYKFNSGLKIGSSVKQIYNKAKTLPSTARYRVFGSTSENRRRISLNESQLTTKDLELFNTKTDTEKQNLSSQSHTDRFVELRSAKIKDHGKETDFIMKNLEKYLNNDKRNTSLWQNLKIKVDTEMESKICFSCKKYLKRSRRRYHCKLCDATLCDTCSLYYVDANGMGSMLSKLEVKQAPPKKGAKPLRHCIDCNLHLKIIQARSNDEDQDTKLIETYKEMQNLKRQLTETVITYKEITQSLVNGEIVYDLSQAVMVKEHIGKRGKEIAVLGQLIGESPAQTGTRQAKLHAAIKKATDDFVKELLGLPKVPAADAVEDSRLRNSSQSRRNSYLEQRDGRNTMKAAYSAAGGAAINFEFAV